MSENYKAFTLNVPGDPKPWGAIENQAIKDIIATLVEGTVAGAKATLGHQHYRLRHISNGYDVVRSLSDRVKIFGNGEGMSRGLNITERDFFSEWDWADLSSSFQQIVGWTTFEHQKIYVRQIGKIWIIRFNIRGESNANEIYLTPPVTITFARSYLGGTGVDLSHLIWGMKGSTASVCTVERDPSTGRIYLSWGLSGARDGWATSGMKHVSGQFMLIED